MSGTELVFKRLTGVKLPKGEFEKRVAAIGAINNEHIRPLRGYYYGNNEQLLLYYDHMLMALPHGKSSYCHVSAFRFHCSTTF